MFKPKVTFAQPEKVKEEVSEKVEESIKKLKKVSVKLPTKKAKVAKTTP